MRYIQNKIIAEKIAGVEDGSSKTLVFSIVLFILLKNGNAASIRNLAAKAWDVISGIPVIPFYLVENHLFSTIGVLLGVTAYLFAFPSKEELAAKRGKQKAAIEKQMKKYAHLMKGANNKPVAKSKAGKK